MDADSGMQNTVASSKTPTREDLQALSALYYDVAASRLEAQLDSIDNIDGKSTSFFTIGSTVLPVVGGFLASDRSPSMENEVARTFLLLGFVAYLLLALCYVWSFRTAR